MCDRVTAMYEGRSVDDQPISQLDIDRLVTMITRSDRQYPEAS